jgi:hypothetical protein
MDLNVEVDQVNTPAVSVMMLPPVFALSLFTSAALLFCVLPLVAKMLLPLLGGVPAVWNTCMLFFPGFITRGLCVCSFDLSTALTKKSSHHSCDIAIGRGTGAAFCLIESRTRIVTHTNQSDSLAPNYFARNGGASFFPSLGDRTTAAALVFIFGPQVGSRSLLSAVFFLNLLLQ